MKTTAILVCAVFILVFVIDLAYSQEKTPQNGNPNTDNNKNITNASDTTNNDNVPAKANQAGNGNSPARTQAPNRPNKQRRRRIMRRRRKKFGRGRQNMKRTTAAPIKSSSSSTTTTTTTRDTSPISGTSGIGGSSVQENEIKIKGASALRSEPKNVNVGKMARKNSPKKKPAAPNADDEFFGLFNVPFTTTEPTNSSASPPPFDPNKKFGAKVMPVVDASKAVDHDGQPCNATYKPHPTIKTKYMMKYAEGVWETLNCPPNLGTGLVWRQDLCLCGEELVAQDPNDWCAMDGFNPDPSDKRNYIRKHHGVNAVMSCNGALVWSQKKCQCIYDSTSNETPIEQRVTFTCKTILHLEFEGNLTNSADGYQIQLVKLARRGGLPRIRYMKTRGAKGKAAMIVSQPLEFQAYRGNDFQTQVTYSVNFKVSPRHQNRKNYMTLLTDECIGTFGGQNKERKPSFSLTFQPRTNSFRLQFRTELANVDRTVSGAKPDNDGWYKTIVYFEDATVNLENNGKKLLSVPDIYGKIPQNKCPLFIAGRGPGYDRSEDFIGYMDNVFLVKDCKFHEANIKFL